MNPSDLDRIERELGIQLPAVYRDLVISYDEELHRWPELPGHTFARKTAFLFDPVALLQATERVRKRMKRRFPARGFVIGGDRGGWWLIDTALPDPPVQLVTPDYILDGFESVSELLDAVRADHAEAWKKARRVKQLGAGAELSPEALIEEGRRLSRPAVALRPRGEDYAAVWRGTGVASPGAGEWRHWISIDTRFLPQNPGNRSGVISVYDWWADDNRIGELKIVHDSTASLPENPDGSRLYAHAFACMPDVDVLFHFGSQQVKDWYKVSWAGDKSYRRTPVKEYLKVLEREHPFQGRMGAYAMIGGWSWYFGWCYGINEEYPWRLFDQALTVLTIEDSEPWIEVFDDGASFTAYSRST